MTVIKNRRGESDMAFLATARKLQIITIQKCKKFPKAYTFYLGVPIANLAKEVHNYVKQGNSIYPTNKHEVQLRRDCFLKAHATLQSLVSQAEVAAEIIGIKGQDMHEWMETVVEEIKLIKAVMKSDHDRYKNIKE